MPKKTIEPLSFFQHGGTFLEKGNASALQVRFRVTLSELLLSLSAFCRACFDGEYPIPVPSQAGKFVLEDQLQLPTS